MEEKRKMLDWALYYHSLDWSIFPVGKDKRPLHEWKTYQQEAASESQISKWWTESPTAGIAVVTGKISGLIVVDVEAGGSTKGLTPTVISKTGGGGWHYFYKHPGGLVKNSVQKIRPLMDIRGDGGYAVIPPSGHPSGNEYSWVVSPKEADLIELPEWILSNAQGDTPKKDWNAIAQGVTEGSRNDTAASYIGKLLHSLPPELWESAGWASLMDWNGKNNPPLSEQELKGVFKSIMGKEQKGRMAVAGQIEALPPQPWKAAVPFREMITKEFSEPPWIVESIVPANCVTVLSGAPGLYKSFLLSSMAICCATGQNFLGKFSCKKTAVMIVDEENTERRLIERIKLLTDEKDLPIFFHVVHGFKLDKPGMLDSVIDEAKKLNIGLIIFDTLIRIHNFDENDASEMSKTEDAFKRLTQMGITVVAAHHHKKQGKIRVKADDVSNFAEVMRGSSAIYGMIDAHLGIHEVMVKDGVKLITLVQTKLRDAELLPPFQVKVESGDGEINFIYSGEYNASETAVAKAQDAILEILNRDKEGLCKDELVEMVKDVAKDASVRAALKELSEAKKIYSKNQKQLRSEGIVKDAAPHKKFYFLNVIEPEAESVILNSKDLGLPL